MRAVAKGLQDYDRKLTAAKMFSTRLAVHWNCVADVFCCTASKSVAYSHWANAGRRVAARSVQSALRRKQDVDLCLVEQILLMAELALDRHLALFIKDRLNLIATQ